MPCLRSGRALPPGLAPNFFRPNFFVRVFSSEFFRQNFFVGIFSSEFFRPKFFVRIFLSEFFRPDPGKNKTKKSFFRFSGIRVPGVHIREPDGSLLNVIIGAVLVLAVGTFGAYSFGLQAAFHLLSFY